MITPYIYIALYIVCSIHLDDMTAAIMHQNAQHTPLYKRSFDSFVQKVR